MQFSSNKITNKRLQQQIDEFHALCETIEKATPVSKDKDESSRLKRIQSTLKSFESFVYYYFPHYATSKLAPFHIAAAMLILENPRLKAVFKWHRGAAKSVMMNVIIPMWLKAQGEFKVMVLVGKSEDNARTLLSDLQAELMYNKRYLSDYGDQMSIGDWQEGNFTCQDGVAFFARGRGQSPRGLRKRQNRPDYIVIDDLDDDELVQNEKRVRKMVDWILEALLGAMDMGRGRFIMVGNLIHKKAVLAKISEVETFQTIQINVFDALGNISWPDKYTLEEIEDIRKTMGSRRFSKEYLNNPIEEGTVFREEWFRFIRVDNYKQYERVVCYIDPSLTGNSGSDYKAAVVVGKTKHGHFHILRSFCRRCSIQVLVKWLYDTYNKSMDVGMPVLFYVEAVFAQDYNIRQALKTEATERGMQFPLRSDDRQKDHKFLRVEGTSVFFENGFVWIDDKLEKDKDTLEGIEQFLAFEKGSSINDDYPDAFEGAHFILQWRSGGSSGDHKPSFHHQTRNNRY